ncbi:hypothetical protein BST61_g3848 [Cercospora zeina]
MAIHPSFPRMPVTIIVNGHPLHEHEDREATPDHEGSERDHVLRYIEIPDASANIESPSDSGLDNEDDAVPFQIHADVHGLRPDSYAGSDGPASQRGDYGLAFHISVDGKDVDALLIYPAMIKSHYANGKTCISKGRYITADSLLPYRFKVIKLVDATSAAARGVRTDAEKEKLEQLGKVRICVYHVRKQGLATPAEASDFQDKSIQGLDEVDLKGKSLSHSVGFGDAIPDRGAAAMSEVEPVNLENGPDACYEFRYGSRDALKKAHIIPRTPSPEPEDPDADLHNMTKEDLLAMALSTRKREREQDTQTVQVKQEIMEAEENPIIPHPAKTILCIDDDDEGFTEEPLPEPLTKRPRIQPITLDEDDEEIRNEDEMKQQPLFVPEGHSSTNPTESGNYDFFGEFQNRFGHNLGDPRALANKHPCKNAP